MHAFAVAFTLALSASPLHAQEGRAVVLELRDGGFVRGRVLDRSASGDVELLRTDGVHLRYAHDEIAGLSAPEHPVFVPVTSDRSGLSLELIDGPETPSIATRTTRSVGRSSTQLVFVPPIGRSDRRRLCLLPCMLSITPGAYVFALSTGGTSATPPLPTVSVAPGDELRARYVDRQPRRTTGLVLVLSSVAPWLGSGAMLLGAFPGLDASLSLGLAVGSAAAAIVQVIVGIVLLTAEDDGRIEVHRSRLARDPSARTATDPISNRTVDKSEAVIARTESGEVR